MDKLAHIQAVLNCRYSVEQMCTREDTLAQFLGALYLEDVMNQNELTTVDIKTLYGEDWVYSNIHCFFGFQVKFRVTDVQVPDIPGMFTTFKANNVPLFVDGEQFDRPLHFGKIMGYDKPLNLRWDGEHTQSEAEARRKKKLE